MKLNLVSPVLMWCLIAVGAYIGWLILPGKSLFETKFIYSCIFTGVFILWMIVFVWSFLIHKNAAKGAGSINKLIKTGPYAYIRHPIYAADIFLSWAILLVWPDIRILVAVVWANAIFVSWSSLEERALIQKFGKEYLEYKKKTPKYFPRF